jgi:hypothetical protein
MESNKKEKIIIKEEWKQENGKYKCPYCGKEYHKYGIGAHIWRIHEVGKNHIINNGGGWNKGLTKENNESVKLQSTKVKELWENGNYADVHEKLKGRTWNHSKESIEKMKNNPKCGGLRHGAGRGKKGWYKGYWCDSSWELAWVIYNLDHKIKFKRNKEGFDYIFENNQHKYYPDFILEDGTYVEIKGYYNERSKIKQQQFNYNLELIDNKKINKYLNYVIEQYGNNFIKLYENSDYIYKNKLDQLNKILKNELKNKQFLLEQNIIKEKILNSDIDFSKFGWVCKVAKLINKKTTKN